LLLVTPTKAASMPIFKCLACETRLYKAAGPDDLAGDLCPGCGSLLEPVGDFVARREAFLAQAQLDARRWVDDDGRFRAEAVPLARPEASP
jgi:hypothetical protein